VKTSLGIWALGPMVTRFVPGGYQPERSEPVAEKVARAVAGLGDLMDDYEFHYPGELSHENLDDVRAALDGHGIYAIASGLHVDPRFGKGGLSSLDDSVRGEAVRLCLEAADLCGEVGAQMIVWPGGEGYNYPFQVPYAEAWARLLDGIAQTAERLAEHGRLLFLEHKNSEPAMKIHMRNIGMTLFVISKLRERGIANVKVNMDWQHLIMNGERLGFDLYPYTEDQVAAVKRSVLQWRFIDSVAARIDEPALRKAQSRRDAVRAYELVYEALGA
jgi:xylose isomerase